MNIYVGNLSYNTTNELLQEAFSRFGEVSNAHVIRDRETGRSRGFGFVEMPNDAEARQAIAQLNGGNVDGRKITANEARPREERPAGGGGGGGYGGGGGSYGGGGGGRSGGGGGYGGGGGGRSGGGGGYGGGGGGGGYGGGGGGRDRY
jgi:RNA recognition motif-containing protein